MRVPRDKNPRLQQFARELRHNPTEAEIRMWSRLRDRLCDGWRFRRQTPIAGYIVDFYCPSARLVIELDGGQHGDPDAEAYDAERSRVLERHGLTVLRFWNNDVLARTDAVVEEIICALRQAARPHPGPLPEYRERGTQAVAMSDDPRLIWNDIAVYWDGQVGEGNDFQKQLVMPATDRLLTPRPGERVMDACCGNGNYARRLGRAGCDVIAFDGAAAFIEIARGRTHAGDGRIGYHVADACDRQAVEAVVGEGRLDAAVCSFALMDLPTIDPLLQAIASRLKPGGRFVWSVGHPAFHTNESQMIARQDHGEGEPTQAFGVEVRRYAADWPHLSRGLLGQPRPHWIYHRSLSTLLSHCFAAGFVVDGMEEPTFAPDTRARSPFSWARRPDIPPALAVRCRKP